jgi:hypothetical protein
VVAEDLTAERGEVEGVGRVVFGVLLTLALWAVVPFFFTLAITFSPPFVLAIVVATWGHGLRWTRRTAVVSTVIFALASVVQGLVYVHDSGHVWSVGYTIVFSVLAVAATWLAWIGGLVIARHRRTANS